jgi:hypothetical protein
MFWDMQEEAMVREAVCGEEGFSLRRVLGKSAVDQSCILPKTHF